MQLRKLQQRSKHGAAAPPFSFLQLPPSRNKSVLFLTPLRDPPPSWSKHRFFFSLFDCMAGAWWEEEDGPGKSTCSST